MWWSCTVEGQGCKSTFFVGCTPPMNQFISLHCTQDYQCSQEEIVQCCDGRTGWGKSRLPVVRMENNMISHKAQYKNKLYGLRTQNHKPTFVSPCILWERERDESRIRNHDRRLTEAIDENACSLAWCTDEAEQNVKNRALENAMHKDRL